MTPFLLMNVHANVTNLFENQKEKSRYTYISDLKCEFAPEILQHCQTSGRKKVWARKNFFQGSKKSLRDNLTAKKDKSEFHGKTWPKNQKQNFQKRPGFQSAIFNRNCRNWLVFKRPFLLKEAAYGLPALPHYTNLIVLWKGLWSLPEW